MKNLLTIVLLLVNVHSYAATGFTSQITLLTKDIHISFSSADIFDVGCTHKVVSVHLEHPRFDNFEAGIIELKTIRTQQCQQSSNDQGEITFKRGLNLPALIMGDYKLIINKEFIQILNWTPRVGGGCETGNGHPMPCF